MLVIGGLALFIYDSITFNTKNEYYDFDKLMFERRTWWERVTFDFVFIYLPRLLFRWASWLLNFPNTPQIWTNTILLSSPCSSFRIWTGSSCLFQLISLMAASGHMIFFGDSSAFSPRNISLTSCSWELCSLLDRWCLWPSYLNYFQIL